MDQVFRNGKVIMAIRSTATKQQARRRGIPTLREKPYLNKINPLSIKLMSNSFLQGKIMLEILCQLIAPDIIGITMCIFHCILSFSNPLRMMQLQYTGISSSSSCILNAGYLLHLTDIGLRRALDYSN